MELTLNLVWVCVAIAGILVQMVMLSRTVSSPERPVSHCRKIVAMVCSLVILFFVISMTDDLHDQELLLEENRPSRMTGGTRTAVSPAPDRLISPSFLAWMPPSLPSPPQPAWSNLVGPGDSLLVPTEEHDSFGGRAPPLSLT